MVTTGTVMSTKELVLTNVNETIRGFIVDGINDIVDEKYFEISLPCMREALTTINLEISIRAVADV